MCWARRLSCHGLPWSRCGELPTASPRKGTMDNVPKETHVVSVMTHKSLETVEKVRDEKDDRLVLHPIRRRNRLTTREKNPQRDQAKERKALWTRVKFHADSNSVKTRHVSSGILPCVRITSLKKDVYTATNVIFDMLRQKERRTKDQRKVVQKDQLRY